MENLASVLSRLMSEKGIKSAELARKTNIGQPVIYRLMTGTTNNPQILTLKPIANFFNVTIDQLLGYSSLETPIFNNTTLHTINNKLVTIKTIASALVELLPALITGYNNAVSATLIKEEVPADILPLLPLNCVNLLKIISWLQEILITNKNVFQEK